MNRRSFIHKTTVASGGMMLLPFMQTAGDTEQRLTILHTNDLNSQLEPFAMDGSKNQGLGGLAERASMINKIRQKEEQVLLLDAGGIFGHTPCFELFTGEPEIKAMSAMKYDAVTVGDDDFIAGVDNYANMISKYASFSVVICNYYFLNTSLAHQAIPYKIFQKGNLKVGVLGVGIDLAGLVEPNLYKGVSCLDPIENANKTADALKRKESCDLIICLSHLGHKNSDGKISDEVLAKETQHIDLIVSAHTDVVNNEPLVILNKRGSEVIINQAGKSGISMGRLDYNLLKNEKKFLQTKTVFIGKKYED